MYGFPQSQPRNQRNQMIYYYNHRESNQQIQSKKSKWTLEEDDLLRTAVELHGEHSWKTIASLVPGRNSKQCRERWTAQLNPDLNKDEWTAQEDSTLIQMQAIHGNLWARISSFLPGRSANSVKNRFNWLTRRNLPQKMREVIQKNSNNIRYCSSLPSDDPPFFPLATVKSKSLDNDDNDSYIWDISPDFVCTQDGKEIDSSFSDQWFY
ncbi:Myb-like DNA-binding domain containing protein [Tritrichomonas foetus]|uniref:Myb-like DNA-binding domain containing protein n=1 Tax=Tritrichomonas foetus TaxID=1144522 RepID=A0A1J4J3P6_9EUKA|nr:Myb-like DNA-binding domain containing protein [Tritrichomonas foetus]|eukprot:OHS93369.1 Myb-like DNA-binding domain containing protein [Tritrichomonas foetus]